MLCRIVAAIAATALFAPAQTSEIEHGRAVYRSNCAFCHGMAGLGGRGPNLVSGDRKSDNEIKEIVRNGVPGSTMPAFWNMSDEQLNRLIAFLRHLAGGAVATEQATGDPAAGRGLYDRSGCAGCHAINGRGSTYGPDLSRIGAQRSVAYLRESITDPSADIPTEYEAVSVTTPDGRKVTGIRTNEDTFSVQIRLPNQRYASFVKDQAKAVEYPKTSLMPAYKNFAPADLDNLIAYLKTLRGTPATGDVREAGGIR